MVPVVEVKGARIPAIGLGTMTLKGDVCVEAVSAALKMGYRHIDTAVFYGNEAEVGEGIRKSGVARDEIFLTTKVRHTDLAPGDFETSVENSLKRLDLPYVDLLLIHWPSPELPLTDYILRLCEAKRKGQAKHIGVANFNLAMIDEVMRLSSEPIVNLQTEFHPYINPVKVLAGCKQRGVVLTGYCPLGRGGLIGDPVLVEIARTRRRTAAQIALRWSVQNGAVPLPRSSNPGRIAENLAIFDFELTADEMARRGVELIDSTTFTQDSMAPEGVLTRARPTRRR